MSCDGCKPDEGYESQPQHATCWRAWYVNGQCFTGHSPEEFAALPDEGVIGVVVRFNDGTFRNIWGAEFYGAYQFNDGFWSILFHEWDHQDALRRYPDVAWKAGVWVSDAEMQHAIREMNAVSAPIAHVEV